jgi:hypothetical protein
MWLPFRSRAKHQVAVLLYVDLGFQHGRLADLVQLLAHSDVIITDLQPDRSLYHVGMPERSTEVTFLVKTASHKTEILAELAAKGFAAREVPRFHS